MLLLARGKAAGLRLVRRDSPNAFLASLAPLIAFPLVGTGLLLAAGKGADAVADFLAVICALLSPAVLSHVLARLWGREAAMAALRDGVQLVPVDHPRAAHAVAFRVRDRTASRPLGAARGGRGRSARWVLYALWLQWFLARHGLVLSGWRAAGMVAWVNLGTAVGAARPDACHARGRARIMRR